MSEVVEIKISPDDILNESIIEKVLFKKRKSKSIPKEYRLIRRSLDSRQKNIFFLLRYELFYAKDDVPEAPVRSYKDVRKGERILVVGAGPAGYFAALELIELGLKPIVLDRGKDVQSRRRDLRAIQQDGIVNPHSNYCFGEGGAGTYSDGKLYTRSHKRGNIIRVLHTLHQHGASDDILVDAHPHIGSNKLPKIVSNLRETIEEYGGEVHFDTHVVDFLIDGNQIVGVQSANGDKISGQHVILATGHSARDIFYLLEQKKIQIEAKDYAIGVRIEHPQNLIDKMQYKHAPRHENLPAASYKLATEIDSKGVFSFCMCPGGLIVPAATAPGELVVNGMSLSRRDSPFSNSGFVTAVNHQDFKEFAEHGVFAGLMFQQKIEQEMWAFGDGSQKAPAQKVPDFLENKVSPSLNETSYIPGIYSAPMDKVIPAAIIHRLKAGLKSFGKRYPKYVSSEAQIIGIESRTSSPIRIPRNRETGLHPQIKGLYPCGEGAGYAGGILSACMDGEFVARKVAEQIGKV